MWVWWGVAGLSWVGCRRLWSGAAPACGTALCNGPCVPSPPLPADHRRKKAAGNNAAPLPRAVDPERSRTRQRMQRELGALGLDAGVLGGGCVWVDGAGCEGLWGV